MSAGPCGGGALSGTTVSTDVSRHYMYVILPDKYYWPFFFRSMQVHPEDGKPEKALQVLRSLCQEDGLELANSFEESEK